MGNYYVVLLTSAVQCQFGLSVELETKMAGLGDLIAACLIGNILSSALLIRNIFWCMIRLSLLHNSLLNSYFRKRPGLGCALDLVIPFHNSNISSADSEEMLFKNR